MIKTYTKWFNVILDTGVIPDSWSNGVILPLFKNKGSRYSVDNYRGITILSCLGKLFTSKLNTRLTQFVEAINLIGIEQAGFRKSFSTIDQFSTIHTTPKATANTSVTSTRAITWAARIGTTLDNRTQDIPDPIDMIQDPTITQDTAKVTSTNVTIQTGPVITTLAGSGPPTMEGTAGVSVAD